MSETIAVLFIFFVLIIFGIIFYYNYQKVAIAEKQEELLGARAMDTTLRSLFLPELQCTVQDAEPEENCIDLMKLRHADAVFQEYMSEYYFEIFSYAKISIVQVFPVEENEETTYVLYDKPKPEYTRKEPTYFVVALRDEVAGKSGLAEYGYGYVTVEVYS